MRKLLSGLSLAVLFLTFATTALNAQNIPFKGGEKFTVVVHYKLGFSADLAEINIATDYYENSGDPYYHVVLKGATLKAYENLYNINDLYEAKFSAKDMTPVYFHMDVHEGKYWAKTFYDWKDDGKTLHAVVDKRNRAHRDTLLTFGPVIRDIVNLVYTGRTLDFKALEKNPYFSLMGLDKDVFKVRISFVCREQKKVAELGTFKTVKVAVALVPVTERTADDNTANDDVSLVKFDYGTKQSLDDEEFNGENKVYIWFSDDAARVPLYFSANAMVGSLNGRVSTYSGLKYPLTSKVK